MPPTGTSIDIGSWATDPKLAETIGSVWNMAYPFLSLVVAVLLFAILFDHIMGVLGRFLNVFFYGGDGDTVANSDGESGDGYSGGDMGTIIPENFHNPIRGNQPMPIDEILWERPSGFSFPTFSLPQFLKPTMQASYQPELYGNKAGSKVDNQPELYGNKTGSSVDNQPELYGNKTGSNVDNQPELYGKATLIDRYPMLSSLARLTGVSLSLPQFLNPESAATSQVSLQPNMRATSQVGLQPNMTATSQVGLQSNMTATSQVGLQSNMTATPQVGLQSNMTATSQVGLQPNMTTTSEPTSLSDRYPILRLGRLTGWLTR